MNALRWLAIANPAAGLRGAAVTAAGALLREERVVGVEVTRAPGDAARIAREAGARGDIDGIVAVGGDGTTFEILAGLDRARLGLALVPMGHGNSLARDFGLGEVPLAYDALAAATGASLREIDLMEVALTAASGSVTLRLGACTFAAGYVADVVDVGRLRLAGLGRAAYAVGSTITRPQPLHAGLTLDGQEVAIAGCTGIVVNNTAHLANFRALPAARLDDGLVDVIGLAAGWPRQVAHNACILSGSTRVSPALLTQAAHARIVFDAARTVMLDGELLAGIAAVEIRVLARACRCVGAP